MNPKHTRIGVIGTNWGRMHIGGFRSAGAQVTALCGRDPQKTAAIAVEEGIPLATVNIGEFCSAVDIVVVSGPDSLHSAHIHAALDAGCHVLSEKPLTRTASDARDLALRAAKLADSGRICAVSFPYRMVPPILALSSWLQSRSQGQWLTVTLRSSFADAEGHHNDGPLMGASGDFAGASHVLDAAFWLMGARPLWVEAVMMGRPAHSLAMHIGLDSGGVVSVNHLNASDPGIQGDWHLVGVDWEARFSGEYRPAHHGWRLGPTHGYDSGTETWQTIGEAVAPGPAGEPWALAHRETAAAMLAAVRGESAGSLADFAAGAVVQEIFAAAMRSERERRRVALSELSGP